jgi:opacity protein-like surface antigen
MKKVIVLLMVLGFISISSMKAQDFRFSAGLELALPMGDFGDAYPLGYGLSLGGELPFADKFGATLTAGYTLLSVDSDLKDFVKSSGMIPVQAGIKYYISEAQDGLYFHGQIGVHSLSVTTEDITIFGQTTKGTTESDTNLSFALGAGYFISESIDLGLRYNIITSSEDGVDASSYLGLRAAFNF